MTQFYVVDKSCLECSHSFTIITFRPAQINFCFTVGLIPGFGVLQLRQIQPDVKVGDQYIICVWQYNTSFVTSPVHTCHTESEEVLIHVDVLMESRKTSDESQLFITIFNPFIKKDSSHFVFWIPPHLSGEKMILSR